MSTPIYRHDLDPTGLSPDNRVLREPVVLANRPVRVFVPQYGAFFGESMVLTDAATGIPLLKTQYYVSQLAQMPTRMYGKGIYYCVVITDSTVSPNLFADYQALGGDWAYSNSALADQLQTVLGDNRAVNWFAVINKPDRFSPGPHLHDAGDVFGMEYVIEALYAIRDAVGLDNTGSMISIYDKIMLALDNVTASVQTVRTDVYQSINGLLDQIAALQLLANRVTALENNVGTRFVTPSMLSAAMAKHVIDLHSQPPTYNISENVVVLDEGAAVVFTINTSNVADGTTLYWSTVTSDAILPNDFTDGTMTGLVVIMNNTGTVTRTLILNADITNSMEVFVPEHFSLQVRTVSVTGVVVATSKAITVNDKSVPPVVAPTYTINASNTSRDEGTSVVFTVTTTGVADGVILAYKLNGNITGADFVDGLLTGLVTITGGVAQFVKEISNDMVTEGTEYFNATLAIPAIPNTVIATSPSITINDTSVTITPTYSVVPASTNVNEGSIVNFNVVTTNVADGTTLYWTTSSSTVTADDFADTPTAGVLSGSFLVNGNAGLFSRPIKTDSLTEGTEYFAAQIRTGSITGTVVATSAVVTINDTSTAPVAVTYAITPSTTSVNEGNSVTFNVATTGVANGTELFWEVVSLSLGGGPLVTADDFTDGIVSGSVIINNNSASFTRTLKVDSIVEHDTFWITLKTVLQGATVATSAQVSVIDSAVAPVNPTYAITPSTSSVTEGNSVSFNIATTNVTNGTVLYWNVSSFGGLGGASVNAADFTDGAVSGTVTINNNAASFSRTLATDSVAENDSFWITLQTGSASGPVVATSSSVTVIDSATAPTTPTYSVTTTTTNVNEGGSVGINISGTNIPNGTALYWTTSGSASGADFTDGSLSGNVSISSNSGYLSRTLVNDQLTEGAESFAIQFHTGGTGGPIVTQTPSITINDTSTAAAAVPTYAIWADTSSINEGGIVNFTMATTNVPDGTILFLSTGGNVVAADFGDNVVAGGITIQNNAATMMRPLANDLTTEGAEWFNLSLRTGSISGPIVATSGNVTINDTSTTAVAVSAYSLTVSKYQIGGGDDYVVFFLNQTTGNDPSNTQYYFEVVGTNPLTGGPLDSLHVYSQAFNAGRTDGTFIKGLITPPGFPIYADPYMTTDWWPIATGFTFTVRVHSGSLAGPVIATSPTITVLAQ